MRSNAPRKIATRTKKQTVTYAEKLAIGYRWYDANAGGGCAMAGGLNPCIAFPFGHGLSYSSVTTGAPKLTPDAKTGGYSLTMSVKNSGRIAGGQVVQVYLSLPIGANALGAAQPPKRLVGFQHLTLAPGETKPVTIAIDPAAANHPLGVWSSAKQAWVTPTGTFTVWSGTSAAPRDLAQAGTFQR